jgi:hypothetical protein
MKNRFLFAAALIFALCLLSCKGSKDAGYSVRYTDHGATAPSPGQEPKYDTPSEGNGEAEPASDGDGKD